MGRIELTCFFSCISGEHANEILIDKPQNIVVLLAIHRNFIDESDEFSDSLGLFAGSCT